MEAPERDSIGAFKDMKVYERDEAVNQEIKAVFAADRNAEGEALIGGSSGGGSREVNPLPAIIKDVSAPGMADKTGGYWGYYLPAFLVMLALATFFIRRTRARANS